MSILLMASFAYINNISLGIHPEIVIYRNMYRKQALFGILKWNYVIPIK